MAHTARPERDGRIVKLHRRGYTLTRIGKRFGISRQRVWQIIQNYTRQKGT